MDKKELTKEQLLELISNGYIEYFKKYETEFKNAMMDAIIYGKGTIEYTNSAEIRHVPYDPYNIPEIKDLSDTIEFNDGMDD